MENKILITTDSTADLEYLFEERHIDFLPLTICLGEETGKDILEINPEKIFEYYEKNKKTPKTSAVSPEEYYSFFKERTSKGYEVIHFTISKKMSSCYENACKAATECGGVRVVDTKALSTGIALSVLYADDLVKEGLTAADIYNKVIERLDDVNTTFVVDTLEFLAKGGRCGGVVAFLASVLKLKPEIVVKEGELVVGKKYLGKIKNVTQKYVKETLEKYPDIDPKYIFVTHTHASEEIVSETKKYIQELIPEANIYETIAGSSITSHCGKGTLGVLFFKHKIS